MIDYVQIVVLETELHRLIVPELVHSCFRCFYTEF